MIKSLSSKKSFIAKISRIDFYTSFFLRTNAGISTIKTMITKFFYNHINNFNFFFVIQYFFLKIALLSAFKKYCSTDNFSFLYHILLRNSYFYFLLIIDSCLDKFFFQISSL